MEEQSSTKDTEEVESDLNEEHHRLLDELEDDENTPKEINMSAGAVKLRTWLNKTLRIEMSDGRVLIGAFLCTDRDANVILGSCTEYLPEEVEKDTPTEESRMLGLVMIPGKHIVTICIDEEEFSTSENPSKSPLSENVSSEEVM